MEMDSVAATINTGDLAPWDEIKAQYPEEWVVLVGIDWSNMTVDAGVVFAHSPDKKTAYALAKGLRKCAILWTGEIRPPTPWVLQNVAR